MNYDVLQQNKNQIKKYKINQTKISFSIFI